MTPVAKAHWQIHVCVLLWGFTAILGKLITLPALPLVWWRMLLVAGLLLLLPRVWRGLRAMPARLRWSYAGVGALVALLAAVAVARDQEGRQGLGELHRDLASKLELNRRYFVHDAAHKTGLAISIPSRNQPILARRTCQRGFSWGHWTQARS